jgi:hypothetical protein
VALTAVDDEQARREQQYPGAAGGEGEALHQAVVAIGVVAGEAIASWRIRSAFERCGYRGSMSNLKSTVARKAVKATAKHTAHGTASKLKREPLRAGTLLAAGALFGFFAGRVSTAQHSIGAAPVRT